MGNKYKKPTKPRKPDPRRRKPGQTQPDGTRYGRLKSTTVPAIEDTKGEPQAIEPKRFIMAMTPARIKVFLEDLAKHGSFPAACRTASPHSRKGCLSTFKDMRKDDPEFAMAVEESMEEARGRLEAELYRRGVEGWDDPVFQRGEQVGTIRKYSDRLLEIQAKAKLGPEYREQARVEHAHAGVFAITDLATLTKKMSKESRDELRKIIIRETERQKPAQLTDPSADSPDDDSLSDG